MVFASGNWSPTARSHWEAFCCLSIAQQAAFDERHVLGRPAPIGAAHLIDDVSAADPSAYLADPLSCGAFLVLVSVQIAQDVAGFFRAKPKRAAFVLQEFAYSPAGRDVGKTDNRFRDGNGGLEGRESEVAGVPRHPLSLFLRSARVE